MNVDLKSATETSLKYFAISSCVLAAQFAAAKIPPNNKGSLVNWLKSSTAIVVGVVGSSFLIDLVSKQKVLKISSANKTQKLVESNL